MEKTTVPFTVSKQTNGCSLYATKANNKTANNNKPKAKEEQQQRQQQQQQTKLGAGKRRQNSSSNSNSNNNSKSNSNSSSSSNHNNKNNNTNIINKKNNRIFTLLPFIMTLATLLPMPEARHVHKVAAANAAATATAAAAAAALPSWHVNPFYGLSDASDISDSQTMQSNSIENSSYDNDDDDDDDDNIELDSDLASAPASSSSAASASASSSASVSVSASQEDELAVNDKLSDIVYDEMAAYAAAAATLRDLRARRIRQRRRRSHHLHYFERDERKSPPEWENPCGGVYDPDPAVAAIAIKTPVNVRKHLIALRNYTRMELTIMNETHRVIDTQEINTWSHHESLYSFLPALKNNTNKVTLKTWYADMQTYIASFAQLGRIQYKYESGHQISAMTRELHDLLLSARRVLCEIETTINASYPTRNIAKLTAISREAMNERLQFRTNTDSAEGVEVARVDAIFAKAKYYQYLDTMWKLLRRHTRHARHRVNGASYESRSSINGINGGGGGGGAGFGGVHTDNLSLLGSSESNENRSQASRHARKQHKRRAAAHHKQH